MRKTLLFTLIITMTMAACASNFEQDTFTTPGGKKIVLTAIKHASIRIEYDGKEIEVDPLSDLEPVTDYAKFPKADYIIITHDHYDHFDKVAIKILSKPHTTVIGNPSSITQLGYGKALSNGDSIRLADGISLEAVEAYNTTPGHTQFHPMGRDNGYILTLDGFRIYIAGDTEDIPAMSRIQDIDVAFLPVNQPYTMTVEQAAKVARTINPKVLFPYHYSDTKINGIVSLLKGTGIDVRIRNYQ